MAGVSQKKLGVGGEKKEGHGFEKMKKTNKMKKIKIFGKTEVGQKDNTHVRRSIWSMVGGGERRSGAGEIITTEGVGGTVNGRGKWSY